MNRILPLSSPGPLGKSGSKEAAGEEGEATGVAAAAVLPKTACFFSWLTTPRV